MLWVIFAIIALFLWAGINVVDKILREKHVTNSFALTAISRFLGFIPLILIMPFVGVTIPILPILISAIIAGIFFTIAIVPYFEALSTEEASRVIPLLQIIPVFVIIMAFAFLGERLDIIDYIAFFIILLGSVLISLRRTKGAFRLSKAFFLMILSSFLFAVHDILAKYIYGNQNFWNNFFWIYVGSLIGCFLLLGKKETRLGIKKLFTKIDFSIVKLLSLDVLLSFLATIFFFLAVMLGSISLISVLGGFQSIFILVYAILLSKYFPKILKEEIGRKTIALKLIAIFLMFGGLYLIYI